MGIIEQIRRATKRQHVFYRAKKDEKLRHYILDKKCGEKDNGNLRVLVFKVDPKTNRPTSEPSKFRELIPQRIEKFEIKW